MPRQVSERAVVFLIGAVQFVNILDFVMVMPLGPDFAADIGLSTSRLGVIGGSYTASASVAGVLGSLFLDRFDRRKVLAVAMLGLVIGTVAGGLAGSYGGLVLARVVAGAFGGPATSVSLSIVADAVPPERRGKAMGAVMGAFSVASVLGVPAALELARFGGWRTPFFVVGGLGLVLVLLAIALLPPMRGHLAGREDRPPEGYAFLRRRLVWASYGMTAATMMAGFILIPNLSAYFQQNLGYPREDLDLLYMAGGAASFFVLRIGGWLVDRYGSFKVGTVGVLVVVAITHLGFVRYAGVPALPMFVIFMVGMGIRNVAYNTLASKVPRPQERARFMSLQSAVQHLASGIGAFTSALLLSERDGVLVGVDRIAWASIGLSLIVPALLWGVERSVRRGEPSTRLAHPPY